MACPLRCAHLRDRRSTSASYSGVAVGAEAEVGALAAERMNIRPGIPRSLANSTSSPEPTPGSQQWWSASVKTRIYVSIYIYSFYLKHASFLCGPMIHIVHRPSVSVNKVYLFCCIFFSRLSFNHAIHLRSVSTSMPISMPKFSKKKGNQIKGRCEPMIILYHRFRT